MRIRVLFFGLLRDVAGRSEEMLELNQKASVRDVLSRYETLFPQVKALASSLAVAVNQQYSEADKELRDGDEVALLPPVSGGCGAVAKKASITREAIDSARIQADIRCGKDGAVVVFEGTVRNQTRGRTTLYLDYEAYEEMALREMEELTAKSLEQFQIRDVALVHRLGRLGIGETSVLIAVGAAHRAAAFEACRWLIDTLKKTIPIWKKEYFEDGAVWADGEPFPEGTRAGKTRD